MSMVVLRFSRAMSYDEIRAELSEPLRGRVADWRVHVGEVGMISQLSSRSEIGEYGEDPTVVVGRFLKVQLAEDVADVLFDCPITDRQMLGD